ncbi:hypothetical protein ScPMuIL_013574 [Solemya velum]
MSSQHKEDQGTEATMNAPGITGIVEGTENIVVENMQIGGTNILQKDIIERANNIVIENIQIGETNILKKGLVSIDLPFSCLLHMTNVAAAPILSLTSSVVPVPSN